MQTDNVPRSRERRANDNLLTIYIDSAAVNRRKDGMYFISFTANLPDHVSEQVRTMIDDVHFRRIIDTFCRSTDYYPDKSKIVEKSLKE